MGKERLQQPSQTRLSDQVYLILRDAILSGKIKAGEWLRQDTLSAELGVSQITVREALRTLVAEGLVYFQPYKGARVITITLQDLEDIYEIRALLESQAMALAAQRITPDALAAMEALIPETIWQFQPERCRPARIANREFHWIAIESSGRQHLVRVLKNIWNLIDPYIIFSPALLQYMSDEKRIAIRREINQEHHALITVLEQRDSSAARELTLETVLRTREFMRSLFEARDAELKTGGGRSPAVGLRNRDD